MVDTHAIATSAATKAIRTSAIERNFLIQLSAVCPSHLVVPSQPAVSQTHASLANHSYVSRQSGQNTGVERKIADVMCLPVEIARPVFGHRIIIMPMRNTPFTATGVLHNVRVRRKNRSPVTIPGLCEGNLAA